MIIWLDLLMISKSLQDINPNYYRITESIMHAFILIKFDEYLFMANMDYFYGIEIQLK